MAGMTEDQILALIDTYAANSYGGKQGTLSQERAKAIARYNSEPYGNEISGRSQLVSSETRDTIETVIPQLMRIFLSGDNICEFDPEHPQDVGQAKQESRYVNWVATQRNKPYEKFGTWFRDAMLCKNGYIKAWWDTKSDIVIENYKGLTDDQLAMIQQDEEVKLTALTSYPAYGMPQPPQGQPPGPPGAPQGPSGMPPAPPEQPMLHDVTVKRVKQYGCVRYDNVPGEEIMVHVSTRGLDLQDALYVEHRTQKTLSEIRQMGYDVDDDEAGTLEESNDIEQVARDRFSEVSQLLKSGESSDPAARTATFREIWMRVDEDGDGVAELRKLCLVNRTIKADDEADLVPIAAITPVIQPHRHIGYSYYDFLKDIELGRTSMIRSFFDNVYLANNGRYGVNVKNVNVDDMLVSRPGGIVRVDGPPGESIFPLTHPQMGDSAMSGMQFLDMWKKNATGVLADSQSLSADVLSNGTASGISQVISVWQARVEGVARCFAETGMTELFRIIHALTLKNSTGPEKFQVNGEWFDVNPREWTKRTNLTVTVGLGTGSKEAKQAFLSQLAQMQAQGLQIGIATPANIYETGIELTKEMGYKDAERFWTDPRKSPPQPKQPDPLVQAAQVKAQADTQVAQMKAQMDGQMAQVRAQADAAAEQARAQADMQIQQHKIQTNAQLEVEKTRMQLELDAMKHGREQETAIAIARIQSDSKIIAAQVAAKQAADQATQAADSRYPGE
jgi:hypothetical protein